MRKLTKRSVSYRPSGLASFATHSSGPYQAKPIASDGQLAIWRLGGATCQAVVTPFGHAICCSTDESTTCVIVVSTITEWHAARDSVVLSVVSSERPEHVNQQCCISLLKATNLHLVGPVMQLHLTLSLESYFSNPVQPLIEQGHRELLCTKFPAGIPGNFWNSGGNYGEFL